MPGEKRGDECRRGYPELVRAFLTIYDGIAIQYMADRDAGDHRERFFMMVDALLLKAGV